MAVAGQLAFIAAWAIAGVAEPAYSTADQTVSELFSRPAQHPWIVQAGLAALVASYLASASLARRLLAPAGAATVALFVLSVPLVVVVAISPLDCMTNAPGAGPSCFDDVSATHRLHNQAAAALQLCLVATPFTAAWALRGRPACRLAVVIGGLCVLGVAWYVAADTGAHGYGIAQRGMFMAVTGWIVALAVLARDTVPRHEA